MRIITLDVVSREKVTKRTLRAFKGEKQGSFISFASPELLFKILSGKRWELLKMLTGAGPLTIRETARRVGRDVKSVHGDVRALLDSGIIQKTEEGRIVFPYDAVHVNFLLEAA